jgi:hypothetical protein
VWIYISTEVATFLLGVDPDERLVRVAPPIARWTVGKGMDLVLRHYRRGDATIQRIPEQPRNRLAVGLEGQTC